MHYVNDTWYGKPICGERSDNVTTRSELVQCKACVAALERREQAELAAWDRKQALSK